MHSLKKKLHHLENDITNKTDADIKNHIFKIKQTRSNIHPNNPRSMTLKHQDRVKFSIT